MQVHELNSIEEKSPEPNIHVMASTMDKESAIKLLVASLVLLVTVWCLSPLFALALFF